MKVLNFQERVDFVENVCNMCDVVVNDIGDNVFHPAVFDVAFKIYVMKYFFDVDIENKDVNELCELAYSKQYNEFESDMEFDDAVCFSNQIDSLKDACIMQIGHQHNELMVKALLNKKDRFDELVEFIENFLDNIENRLKDVDVKKLTTTANKIVAMSKDQPKKDAVALKVVKGKKKDEDTE